MKESSVSESVYATKREANQAGWFSRRHRTNETHLESRAKWMARKAAKKETSA